MTVPETLLTRGKDGRRSCGILECRFGLRDGHVHLLVLDGHDHVPVRVVAEYPGAGPLETAENLGRGMPVGIVRADLDDCYLRWEAAQEERSRGGVRAVVGDLEDDKGSKVQNGPVIS